MSPVPHSLPPYPSSHYYCQAHPRRETEHIYRFHPPHDSTSFNVLQKKVWLPFTEDSRTAASLDASPLPHRISLTLASPPAGEGPYEPPASPPPREKWEPDGEVTKCRVCRQVYFGMVSCLLFLVGQVIIFYSKADFKDLCLGSASTVQSTTSLSEVWPCGVCRMLISYCVCGRLRETSEDL